MTGGRLTNGSVAAGAGVIAAGVLVGGAPAWAQDSSGQNALPPAPRATDKPPVVIHYAAAVLMAGGVVALSIMPSKRTHQD